MNKSHAILLSVLFIILQGVAISCYNKDRANKGGSIEDSLTPPTENASPINTPNGDINFVTASNMVMSAVVHIKIHFNASSDHGDLALGPTGCSKWHDSDACNCARWFKSGI